MHINKRIFKFMALTLSMFFCLVTTVNASSSYSVSKEINNVFNENEVVKREDFLRYMSATPETIEEMNAIDDMANEIFRIYKETGEWIVDPYTGEPTTNISTYGLSMSTPIALSYLSSAGISGTQAALASILAYIGNLIGITSALPVAVFISIIVALFVGTYYYSQITSNSSEISKYLSSTAMLTNIPIKTMEERVQNYTEVAKMVNSNKNKYFPAARYDIDNNGGIVIFPSAFTKESAKAYLLGGAYWNRTLKGQGSRRFNFSDMFTPLKTDAEQLAKACTYNSTNIYHDNPHDEMGLPHFHYYLNSSNRASNHIFHF